MVRWDLLSHLTKIGDDLLPTQVYHLPIFIALCRPTPEISVTKYNVYQRNNTDVAHYNFNVHQPILVTFGRDVSETVCYQTVICYPTSRN